MEHAIAQAMKIGRKIQISAFTIDHVPFCDQKKAYLESLWVRKSFQHLGHGYIVSLISLGKNLASHYRYIGSKMGARFSRLRDWHCCWQLYPGWTITW